jgi:pSer/pThr/pTyr-binding forkhead associated (FHA) protein
LSVALKLTFDDERGRPRRVALAPELTVGRGVEGNSLRLEARNVSRRHARFTFASGALSVEDLGSRNGTFVNGEAVHSRRRLKVGDAVRIGDYLLRLDEATEDTEETHAERPIATPPPLPRRVMPLAPPAASEERTVSLAGAAPTPRTRRWREALAAALRVISGKGTE